jgi:hypothetical protein
MAGIAPLVNHLGPHTIVRLERAAEQRFQEANDLRDIGHRLAALYFYGYSVEMCLTAAYFRSAGFGPTSTLDRDMRQRRMAQARQLTTASGERLMNSDPHPLVGWARFLERQRSLSRSLSPQESQQLREAVSKAEQVYKHWRPELRYKTTDVQPDQLDEVGRAATWFIRQRRRL